MTGDRDATRAWLDLLAASNAIRKSVDTLFRNEFGVSIARFDVMAALARAGHEGLRAGELSQQLMVTEGNTTQVTAPLVRDGLVRRKTARHDARVAIFSLTKKGERLFERMAEAHHAYIAETFAGFSKTDMIALRSLLERVSPRRQSANSKDAA